MFGHQPSPAFVMTPSGGLSGGTSGGTSGATFGGLSGATFGGLSGAPNMFDSLHNALSIEQFEYTSSVKTKNQIEIEMSNRKTQLAQRVPTITPVYWRGESTVGGDSTLGGETNGSLSNGSLSNGSLSNGSTKNRVNRGMVSNYMLDPIQTAYTKNPYKSEPDSNHNWQKSIEHQWTRGKTTEVMTPPRDYFDHLPQYTPFVVNHHELPSDSRENNKRYLQNGVLTVEHKPYKY